MNNHHMLIAPSAFHITINCPGSVKLQIPFNNQPRTEEQMEGDLAHWVALMMRSGSAVNTLLGLKDANGITVTDDMIAGAEMYCKATSTAGSHANQIAMETSIPITRVSQACGGTPDFAMYEAPERVLTVADYKFGHRYVEIFECWQLILYAIGLMDTWHLPPQTTLRLILVQPRCYHAEGPIREWIIGADMLPKFIELARGAVEEAVSLNPRTITGPHCMDCKARSVCTTLQRSTSSIVDFVGHADPVVQTPDDVGVELHILQEAMQRLEARITGKEEQALALIRAGKRVPFYSLGRVNSRRRWTVPLAEIKALGELYGKTLTVEEPITPKQAEELIDETVISAYSWKPPGAFKLCLDSTTKSRKVFST